MAKTYEPIATTTLGSATSTINFSSIPSTYTDLRVVLVWQGSAANSSRYYFNNDTTTLYSETQIVGDGASASSSSTTNQSYLYLSGAGGAPTTYPGLTTLDIFSYSGSTYKTTLLTTSDDRNGSGYVIRKVGLYRSTSAINRLDFTINGANFNAGTTATIYGILRA